MVVAPIGLTFTVTVAVFLHPADPPVAVSVYVVVVEGLATGLAAVALLNPVVGDQEYVVAPDPVVVSVTPHPPIIIVGSSIFEIKGPLVLLDVLVLITPGAFVEEAPPIQILIGSGYAHAVELIVTLLYPP